MTLRPEGLDQGRNSGVRSDERSTVWSRFIVFLLGVAGGTFALAPDAGPVLSAPNIILLLLFIAPFALYLGLVRTRIGTGVIGLLLLTLILLSVQAAYGEDRDAGGFLTVIYLLSMYSIAVVGVIVDWVYRVNERSRAR